MPDNRELATAILVAAFAIFALSIRAVRQQIPSLLRVGASLVWLLVLYLATCVLLLWGAWEVGLWSPGIWWPTGIVVFGVGIGLTAKAIQARSRDAVVSSIYAETLGTAVIIALYANLISLSLAWELVLQAMALVFAGVGALAAHQKNRPVQRFSEIVLLVIGAVFVGTSTVALAQGMSGGQWTQLAQETLLSFWFPFALLPFLYAMTYYSAVEGATANVRVVDPSVSEKRPLVARFLVAFRFRTRWAAGFDREWGRRYADAGDRESRKDVLSDYRRARNPKFRRGRRWRRIAAAAWDGKSMPRSEGHLAEMLLLKAPGWEYMLFGAQLWIGISEMDAGDRAVGEGSRRSSKTLPKAANQPMSHLEQAFGRAARIIEPISQALTPERQTRAFGPPGSPGNADMIRALSTDLLETYAELIDWAAELRSQMPPKEYLRAYECGARLADGPVRQFREFVADVAAQMDRVPVLIASPDERPVRIVLTLRLSVEDRDIRRFDRALARLRPRNATLPQQAEA